MRLTLNNFGPVKGKQNYSIDLQKNITLVTGANGLGKTYLGYLVYGLIKRFNEPRETTWLFLKNAPKVKNGNTSVSIDFHLTKATEFIEGIILSYKEDLHKYLGIDKRTSDMLFKDISIDILNIDERYKEFVETKYDKTFNANNGVLSVKKESNSCIIDFETTDNEDGIKLFLPFLFSFIISESFLLREYIQKVYYIPVERNSIYTFSKELSLKRSEMIDKMQSFLLEGNKNTDIPTYLRKNAGRYPEAIEDALRQAQDLTQLTKNDAEKEYIKLANDIESEILQGEILINSEGEVEFAPERNRKKRIPVHLSASFIKTISSIILYLKHIASKGDMIMIDEPEMNLHPNLQIVLARILVRISNAGVKIWLSTHSDYIISELNNLCVIGYLKDKVEFEHFSKFGYTKDDFIDISKMQALYLNGVKTMTQVKIENLKIANNGVDIESIDDCLYKLNERTNELNEALENLIK